MKSFTKLLFVFIASVIFLPALVFGGPGTPFNKIVFFGDSLTDNGNLYSKDWGYLPKSPPYFEGRFSNGITWAEHAAKYFYDKNYTGSVNFAFGGETAVFHDPINGFLPYSLYASIKSYWIRTAFRDRSHTLFVVWIGSNDYLNGTNDVEGLTTNVVESIRSGIQSLISQGGMNFLLINLPDFSQIPLGLKSDIKDIYKKSTELHNQKLASMVSELSDGYKEINIQLFDLNTMFVDMLKNIDVYNKKYNLHITNTTESCWGGGYTLKKSVDEENQIYEELIKAKRQTLLKSPESTLSPQVNEDMALAHQIALSTTLHEARNVAKLWNNGKQPCKNPDEYVFWDQVHPTAVVHRVLAEYLINFINDHFVSEPLLEKRNLATK